MILLDGFQTVQVDFFIDFLLLEVAFFNPVIFQLEMVQLGLLFFQRVLHFLQKQLARRLLSEQLLLTEPQFILNLALRITQ